EARRHNADASEKAKNQTACTANTTSRMPAQAKANHTSHPHVAAREIKFPTFFSGKLCVGHRAA
ncbi:hypothetical protein, partial [Paraburkholderia hospita]|uniref:hypothetical protein n=1 Tax=Paraburkholderia hospita TaxID=169430 RepID=UPI001A997C87